MIVRTTYLGLGSIARGLLDLSALELPPALALRIAKNIKEIRKESEVLIAAANGELAGLSTGDLSERAKALLSEPVEVELIPILESDLEALDKLKPQTILDLSPVFNENA